jgi:hypothetical protein
MGEAPVVNAKAHEPGTTNEHLSAKPASEIR